MCGLSTTIITPQGYYAIIISDAGFFVNTFLPCIAIFYCNRHSFVLWYDYNEEVEP